MHSYKEEKLIKLELSAYKPYILSFYNNLIDKDWGSKYALS